MDLFPIKLQPTREAPIWFVAFLAVFGMLLNLLLMFLVAFVIAYGAGVGWGLA